MSRQLISKLVALIAGIALILVAYNHNQSSIYLINGNAYGTTWSIKSSEYIGDHHKENIINITGNNAVNTLTPILGISLSFNITGL